MSNYYTILGVAPDASLAAIEAAYLRQVERYSPALAEGIDPELRQIAEARIAELQQLHTVLSDAERRRQYDVSQGFVEAVPRIAQLSAKRSLSVREQLYAAGGALLALICIAGIWVITGRGATEEPRAMGEVNRPAPAIALPTLDGNQLDLSAFRGQVVLVNFWGTWCEPCRREMPALQSAYTQLRDQGFMVIGVNLTDDEMTNGTPTETIRAFIEQYGVTYPTALDIEGKVTNDYRVFPLPTSFFIDAQGRIRYVHVGELSLDDVTARFNQLKGEAMALSTE
jgi:cytochrome c biogenesis protein CcmG, thiol:disulfide interchange protein DsbE